MLAFRNSEVSLSLDAQAKDDNISTTLDWGNNAATTYSGKLAAVAKFLRTSGEKSLLKAIQEEFVAYEINNPK